MNGQGMTLVSTRPPKAVCDPRIMRGHCCPHLLDPGQSPHALNCGRGVSDLVDMAPRVRTGSRILQDL